METKGTLFKICQTVDISLKDGSTLQKGGFVINSEGTYPKPIYFEIMGGERLQQLEGLNPGDQLQVYFYPESRESKDGRYFSSLRCTGVVKLSAIQPAPAVPQAPQTANTPTGGSKGDMNWLLADNQGTPF